MSKVEYVHRIDGRWEKVCKHGIGHTVYSPNDDYVHGCDGCCKHYKTGAAALAEMKSKR